MGGNTDIKEVRHCIKTDGMTNTVVYSLTRKTFIYKTRCHWILWRSSSDLHILCMRFQWLYKCGGKGELDTVLRITEKHKTFPHKILGFLVTETITIWMWNLTDALYSFTVLAARRRRLEALPGEWRKWEFVFWKYHSYTQSALTSLWSYLYSSMSSGAKKHTAGSADIVAC